MTPIAFMQLFEEFRAASWDGWRAILARLTPNVREFYAIAGRGSGKSRVVALLACYFASRSYPRAPGERIYIGVFGPDRKQSRVTFRYIIGLLKSVPALAALILEEAKESVELKNGIIVEVVTASIAAPRGRAYAVCIVEEAAFLPSDDSANPDVELLRAVRPALARVPGSLLAVVSSPYARRGALYAAWSKYHDQPDSDVVLVQQATLELNPSFDPIAIAKAFEDDPASASAEYGALFRSDVEALIALETVQACTVPGRASLPPSPQGVRYYAFVDPSGGSGSDSFTAAIAHADGDQVVLDALLERRPPFSPEQTVAEFAATLRRYRVTSVIGDHYAGEWPREQFRKHGIRYETSPKTKSELYLALLPILNSGRVQLLDVPRLSAQLVGLERRTSRQGRDSIDHAPGRHDDLSNSAAGALVGVEGAARGGARMVQWSDGAVHLSPRRPPLPCEWVGLDPDPVVRELQQVGEFAPHRK